MEMSMDERSIADLVRELTTQSRTLVRQEIALARTELVEKVSTYRSAMALVVIGGGLALGALLLLLATFNRALTALLALWLPLDIAGWLAPLILALVLGASAYVLVRTAWSRARAEGMKPSETAESLDESRRWIKAEVS